MPTNLEKFRDLLRELFQLDQADLDFGIYRIMNTKRDEILRFLDKDLLPQVKAAFAQYQSADKSALQMQISEAVKQAEGLGAVEVGIAHLQPYQDILRIALGRTSEAGPLQSDDSEHHAPHFGELFQDFGRH